MDRFPNSSNPPITEFRQFGDGTPDTRQRLPATRTLRRTLTESRENRLRGLEHGPYKYGSKEEANEKRKDPLNRPTARITPSAAVQCADRPASMSDIPQELLHSDSGNRFGAESEASGPGFREL